MIFERYQQLQQLPTFTNILQSCFHKLKNCDDKLNF